MFTKYDATKASLELFLPLLPLALSVVTTSVWIASMVKYGKALTDRDMYKPVNQLTIALLVTLVLTAIVMLVLVFAFDQRVVFVLGYGASEDGTVFSLKNAQWEIVLWAAIASFPLTIAGTILGQATGTIARDVDEFNEEFTAISWEDPDMEDEETEVDELEVTELYTFL